MLAMAKPPSFSDLRSLASLAEQREQLSAGTSATAAPVVTGMHVARSSAQQSGLLRSRRTIPQPQSAPPQRGQSLATRATPDVVERKSPDAEAGDDGEVGRRRGRSTLTQEERRERRLLSNRLAAKRSYYRRQNRQSNIKQAIDQVQGELSTAKAKVAMFKQLLRQAGLDPEAILANANVPVAAAATVNSLPMCAHQMPPPQQQQHHPPPPPPQQLQRMPGPPAALLVAKQHRGDGGNVTPPNTLAMPNAPTSQTIFARQTAT